MAFAKLNPQAVKYIAVHCSATQAKADIGLAEITRWHRERNFVTVGYHFIIRRNGTVERGRPTTAIGAHVTGFNAESIGICMVGGLDRDGKAENNFTDDQFAALAELILSLKKEFPQAVVQGHRDFPGVKKDCPCFDVKAWAKETIFDPKLD